MRGERMDKVFFHDYVNSEKEKTWDYEARHSLVNTLDEIELLAARLIKRVAILEEKIDKLEAKDEC